MKGKNGCGQKDNSAKTEGEPPTAACPGAYPHTYNAKR